MRSKSALTVSENVLRQLIRETLVPSDSIMKAIDAIHKKLVEQLSRNPEIVDLVQQIADLPTDYEDYDQMESVRNEFHSLSDRIQDVIRESNPPVLKTLVDMVEKMEEKALSGSYLSGRVEPISRDELEWMVCENLGVRLIWQLSGGVTEHIEEEQATTSPAEAFGERFIISHRMQMMDRSERVPLVSDEDDEDET